MLQLVDYDKNRIIVVYKDCNSTLNKGRVLSAKLQFSADDSCTISNSTVIAFNQEQILSLINGGNPLSYGLRINDKDKDLVKLDFTVYLSSIYNIEGYGDDYVEGSNILNDFSDSTHIIINNVEYEINKNISTINKLYLNSPIQGSVSSYIVPIVYKETLFPTRFLLEKLENMVAGLTNACCEALKNSMEFTIKYTSLNKAISCCDKGGAIKLFNLLKSWT